MYWFGVVCGLPWCGVHGLALVFILRGCFAWRSFVYCVIFVFLPGVERPWDMQDIWGEEWACVSDILYSEVMWEYKENILHRDVYVEIIKIMKLVKIIMNGTGVKDRISTLGKDGKT